MSAIDQSAEVTTHRTLVAEIAGLRKRAPRRRRPAPQAAPDELGAMIPILEVARQPPAPTTDGAAPAVDGGSAAADPISRAALQTRGALNVGSPEANGRPSRQLVLPVPIESLLTAAGTADRRLLLAAAAAGGLAAGRAALLPDGTVVPHSSPRAPHRGLGLVTLDALLFLGLASRRMATCRLAHEEAAAERLSALASRGLALADDPAATTTVVRTAHPRKTPWSPRMTGIAAAVIVVLVAGLAGLAPGSRPMVDGPAHEITGPALVGVGVGVEPETCESETCEPAPEALGELPSPSLQLPAPDVPAPKGTVEFAHTAPPAHTDSAKGSGGRARAAACRSAIEVGGAVPDPGTLAAACGEDVTVVHQGVPYVFTAPAGTSRIECAPNLGCVLAPSG